MKKLSFLSLVVCVFLSSALFAQNIWKQTNGPTSGSTNDMTIDSLQRIYTCTGGGGVYQSTDHGETWTPRCKGLHRLPGRYLESSSAGNKVFVYLINHNNDLARLRSDIEGSEWEYLTVDTVVSKTKFLNYNNGMMTNRKGYLYLATGGSGVIRTKDNGDHWDRGDSTRGDTSLRNSVVQDIAIDRNQYIYAMAARSPQSRDSSLNNFFIFRSTDEGDTWTKFPTPVPQRKRVNRLVVADDGSISVGYYLYTNIYRSTDNGQSWVKSFERDGCPHKDFSLDAFVHGHNSNTLYFIGSGPTFRSTNNGATWDSVDLGRRGDEPWAFATDSLGWLYQCSIPAGLNRSKDSGVTWEDINKNLRVQFFDVGVAINSKGDIAASSQFRNFHSENQGDSWTMGGLDLHEPLAFSMIFDKSDSLYIGNQFGLWRSPDNGDNWTKVIGAPSPADECIPTPPDQIRVVGVSPKNELFASSKVEGFLRSTDHGNTWNPVVGLPPVSLLEILIFDFGKNPSTNYDTIYAAGNTSQIYRSINNGVNWEVISDSGEGLQQFLCHPDGSVFITRRGGGTYQASVDRSTDGGKNWVRLFPPIDDSVRGIWSMMYDRNGDVILCTDSSGLLRAKKSEGFTKWKNDINTGLFAPGYYADRFQNCSQIAQDFRTGVFYAATRGVSLFKSGIDLNLLGMVPTASLSSSITEPTNYPNPFAATTEITIDVPHTGYVKVIVYDVWGRVVEQLHDGMLTEGKHTLTFDAKKNIADGKYLVVEQCGTEMTSHWIVVLH